VSGGVGLADERAKGAVELARTSGRLDLRLRAERSVRDVSDERVIAPLLNSVMAQEFAEDFGDYYLADVGHLRLRYAAGGRFDVTLGVGLERTRSLDLTAVPASGVFRPNPALGSGTRGVAQLSLARRPGTVERIGASGLVTVEVGSGEGARYLRASSAVRIALPIGMTELVARGTGGWGSRDLPRHRTWVAGGRGTLPGESFRAWGGRYAAWGTVEWRVGVPFPAVGLGPFASTGRTLIVAPFVGAGWAGGAVTGVPWQPSPGVRPVVGVGLEWFHRLLRADVALGLREPQVQVIVDVRRDLWPIL
jgi:hypothetical protein